jgi:hypothetical protein
MLTIASRLATQLSLNSDIVPLESAEREPKIERYGEAYISVASAKSSCLERAVQRQGISVECIGWRIHADYRGRLHHHSGV